MIWRRPLTPYFNRSGPFSFANGLRPVASRVRRDPTGLVGATAKVSRVSYLTPCAR